MAGTSTTSVGDESAQPVVRNLVVDGDLDVVDDAELLRLAQQPAEPLLPVLDRSPAMWPLIVVFSLVPVTFAAYYRTFDDAAATWGLRAIDVLAGTTGNDWLAPGEGSGRFAAPLASWLAAGGVEALPASWWASVIAASVIATALTGFGVYAAYRSLAGAQFALWSTLLVCCHPVVLAASTTPAPRALGCCLEVAVFGCLLRHGLAGGRVIGVWNLVAGVLLGATLLASGPFFLVAVGTTVLYAVLRTAFGRPPGSVPVERPVLRSAGAVGLLVGMALLVGGWWLVWVFVRYGSEPFAAWAGLVELRNVATRTSRDVFDVLLRDVGLLAGFVVCGSWRCLQLVRHEKNEPRRVAALLLAWTFASVAGWLVVVRLVPRMGGESFRAWEFTTIVPIVGLAVVGIDAVRDRTVGLIGTTVIALLSILARFAPAVAGAVAGVQWWGGFAAGWILLGTLVGTVAILWSAWQGTRASDRLVRPVIAGVTFGLIFAQVAEGLVDSRRTTNDDRAMEAFHAGLAQFGPADRLYVVGERPLEPRLEYTVRSLWPRVPLVQVPSRDAALATFLADVEVGGRAVLVDVRDDDRPFDDRGGRFDVETVAPRRLFAGRRLRAHVLTLESSPQIAGNVRQPVAEP